MSMVPQSFFTMELVTNHADESDVMLYDDAREAWGMEGGDHLRLNIGISNDTPPLLSISSESATPDGTISIVDRGTTGVTPAFCRTRLEPVGVNKLPVGTLAARFAILRNGEAIPVCSGQVKVCFGSS